uniref:SET domain and mariner transposase fusion gene n=1 Tax=Cyprinus carpio TaxID=7962 RepID=A0A8C1W1R6_CYPCA
MSDNFDRKVCKELGLNRCQLLITSTQLDNTNLGQTIAKQCLNLFSLWCKKVALAMKEKHLKSILYYVPDNVQGPGCDLDPSAVTLPGCSCPTFDSVGRLNQQQEDGTSPSGVQKGVEVCLGVFSTKERGWGVEALERLPCGRFVCEYAREVIGSHEAHHRQLSQTPLDMNYIIAVLENSRGDRVTQTFVDPMTVGNVGRFINHSCQPNLLMVPIRVHSLLPRLALFANRDIERYKELTFDYAGGQNGNTNALKWDKAPTGTHTGPDADKIPLKKKVCHCGDSSCTAFLPLDMSVLH